MNENMASVRMEDRRFGYIVLWFFMLVCGLNFLGFLFVMRVAEGWFISWQELPTSPVPVRELAISPSYIRVIGMDDIVYGKAVYDKTVFAEPWFVESALSSEEVDWSSSPCTLEDLPFSFSPTKPLTLRDCRNFYVHPHAPASYVVVEENGQLWVWVNNWSGGIIVMYAILGISLFIAPFLSVLIVKRLYR